MEQVLITSNNKKVILNIDKKSINGYEFVNNNMSKVNNPIKYFDFLIPSNNYEVIKASEHTIIHDNNTNLNHFIINGYFNYLEFYKNNGVNATLYNGKKKINNIKRFSVGNNTCITMSLLSMTIVLNLMISGLTKDTDYKEEKVEFESIVSTTYLENKIQSSNGLTSSEKKYLCNAEFLNFIIPYINDDTCSVYEYQNKFDNITIDTFEIGEYHDDNCNGYYNATEPNKIHIRSDSYQNETDKKDVLSHEFIHLCQMGHKYNLITEATAEILSYEFFEDAKEESYSTYVPIIEELMELIGSEPIIRYMINDDFTYIENEVKPYLSDKDYNSFKDNLILTYDDAKDLENTRKLKEIFNTLYKAKYPNDSEKLDIISKLRVNAKLRRYYFNEKYINEENSFYYDYNKYSIQSFKLNELLEEDRINVTIITDYLDRTDALRIKEKYNGEIVVNLDNTSMDIKRVKKIKGQNYITGEIDGTKIIDQTIEEAYKDGLINAKALVTYNISYDDYINNNYEGRAAIFMNLTGNTIPHSLNIEITNSIYGNEIMALAPQKVYIKPFETSKKLTK